MPFSPTIARRWEKRRIANRDDSLAADPDRESNGLQGPLLTQNVGEVFPLVGAVEREWAVLASKRCLAAQDLPSSRPRFLCGTCFAKPEGIVSSFNS